MYQSPLQIAPSPIRKSSLKEQAYMALLESLLNGDFRPGDVMDRRGVAKRFGMSVSPVQEAMSQLQFEGLLETMPRHGTVVKRVGREEARGHLILREAFERQAGRMLTAEVLHEQEGHLKDLASRVDSAESTALERARAEVDFHGFLVSLTGCKVLWSEYTRIMRVGLFYRVSMLLPMIDRGVVDPHVELTDNLLKCPDDAEHLLAAHMWSGKPAVLREPTPTRTTNFSELI